MQYSSCVLKADLVVQMVEDASSCHLLEELISACLGKCNIVGTGPLAALHQDGCRRAVKQGCNGDEPKEVDPINVLRSTTVMSAAALGKAWQASGGDRA